MLARPELTQMFARVARQQSFTAAPRRLGAGSTRADTKRGDTGARQTSRIASGHIQGMRHSDRRLSVSARNAREDYR